MNSNLITQIALAFLAVVMTSSDKPLIIVLGIVIAAILFGQLLGFLVNDGWDFIKQKFNKSTK